MQQISICFALIFFRFCTADRPHERDFENGQLVNRLAKLESYVKMQDERIQQLETTVSAQRRIIREHGNEVSRGKFVTGEEKTHDPTGFRIQDTSQTMRVP